MNLGVIINPSELHYFQLNSIGYIRDCARKKQGITTMLVRIKLC